MSGVTPEQLAVARRVLNLMGLRWHAQNTQAPWLAAMLAAGVLHRCAGPPGPAATVQFTAHGMALLAGSKAE